MNANTKKFRFLRKLTATLLTLVMILSVVPIQAFASFAAEPGDAALLENYLARQLGGIPINFSLIDEQTFQETPESGTGVQPLAASPAPVIQPNMVIAPYSNGAPEITGIAITPYGGITDTIKLRAGAAIQFSAVVEGLNNPPQDVNWNCSYGGSFVTFIHSSSGILVIAANHTHNTNLGYDFIVTAVSQANPSIQTSVYVEIITSAPPTPTVTGVNIYPEDPTAIRGKTMTFSAQVAGTGNPSQSVNWSVSGNTSANTSISSFDAYDYSARAGVLTVGADETATSLTIRAESALDSRFSDEVVIAVVDPTASAAVENMRVRGTAGTPLVPYTANITLTNDTVVADGLSDVDAADWFTDLPAGITATASATGGGNTISITFDGTPAVASSAVFDITIPTSALTGGEDVAVTRNAKAYFDIDPQIPVRPDILVAQPVYAHMGYGSPGDRLNPDTQPVHAPTYKVMWTFNNHHVDLYNAYRYRIRVFGINDDIASTPPVIDTGIMESYGFDIVYNRDSGVTSISKVMNLTALQPSRRDPATGAYEPNYKLVVDAYHPSALSTVAATDTVDVILTSLGLHQRYSDAPSAVFVSAPGTITAEETIILGILKDDLLDGTDDELKYSVSTDGGQSFTDKSGTPGVFEQLTDAEVANTSYPIATMTSFRCKSIIDVDVPADGKIDEYLCRFQFASGGETRLYERTFYAVRPDQTITLRLLATDGEKERVTLYDKDYQPSVEITCDDNRRFIPSGTVQVVSDGIIDNLSSFTLVRNLHVDYPPAFGVWTGYGRQYLMFDEADKTAGYDYVTKLSWNYSNFPDYDVEVTVKARSLSRELYIFSVPENGKDYALTYNDKTVTIRSKDCMVAVYEPDGINTDVLLTSDGGSKRATVPNGRLLSGESTRFDFNIGFSLPNINKTSFVDYSLVRVYVTGQDGASLADKTVTVNMALIDWEGKVRDKTAGHRQTIGANGRIDIPALALPTDGNSRFLIELLVEGCDPVLKYIRAIDVGDDIPFSKLPVFVVYRQGASPAMLSGVCEAKIEVAPKGYLSYIKTRYWIDMASLSSGTTISYIPIETFDTSNQEPRWLQMTVVADARKVGANPGNPVFRTNAGIVPLTTLTDVYNPESGHGGRYITTTNLRNKYDFLQGDYYQYDLAFMDDFLRPYTTAAPTFSHGALTLTLPLFSNGALTAEEQMMDALRKFRLEGEREAALDKLRGQGLGGDMDALFNEFTISLPTGLPFTFDVEKKGNEYVVRGILSANLIPGVDGGWASDLGEDAAGNFEDLFNQIMADVMSNLDTERSRTTVGLQLGQGSAFAGVRGYLSGKAVFDPQTNSFAVSFNDGGLIGEVSGGITMPLSPNPLFVVNLTAEGLAKIDLRIKNPTVAELSQVKSGASVRVNLEQETTLAVSLGLKAGPGYNGFGISASAGGYATGSAGSQSLTVIRPYVDQSSRDYMAMYARYYAEGELGLYWEVNIGPLVVGQQYILIDGEVEVLSPDNANNPYRTGRRAMAMMTAAQPYAFSGNQIAAGTSASAMPRYANSYLYHDEGTPAYGDERLMYKPDSGPAVAVGTIPTYDFHSQTSGSVTSVLAQTLDLTPDEFAQLQQLPPEAQIIAMTNRIGMLAFLLDGSGNITKQAALTYSPISMNLAPKTAVSGDDSIYVWKSGSMIFPKDAELPYSTDLVGALVFARGNTTGGFTAVTPITAIDGNFQIESYGVALLPDKTALVAANDKDGNVYCYIIAPNGAVTAVPSALAGSAAGVAAVNGGFAVTCVRGNGDGSQTLLIQFIDKKGAASLAGPMEVSGVGENYQLAVDSANLGVFWTEFSIGATTSNSLLKGVLVDTAGGIIGAPQTIVTAPEGMSITGFDCRLEGKNVSALVNYTDFNGAVQIAAKSYAFANTVNKLGARFDYADYVPGRDMKFYVALENAGVNPITSVSITAGGKITTVDISGNPLNPGEARELVADYTVPASPGGPLDYTVEATFAGGGTGHYSGTLNTMQTDAVIKTLYVDETADTQTFIMGVFNASEIALSQGQRVRVGIYRDALGETALVNEITVSGADELALIDAGGYTARFIHNGALAEKTSLYALVSVLDSNGSPVYDTTPDNNMTVFLMAGTPNLGPGPGSGGSSGGTSSTSATLNSSTATFDKSAPKDVTGTLSAGTYTLLNIKNGSYTLVRDKDYIVNGNTYTIKAEYLTTLADGKVTLVFNMSGGTDPVLTIIIEDGKIPSELLVNPFTDVRESDWFYNSVRFVHQNGLFSGTNATTFSPNVTMTRGMMVMVLWRMAGSPAADSAGFSDVSSDAWYAEAVNWAAENGIVAGIGGNKFAPDSYITREQMAVMLYNYAKAMEIELPQKRTGVFADDADISSWAAEAVNAMYATKILSGKGANIFDPKGKATRAEVATMFMNFAEMMK